MHRTIRILSFLIALVLLAAFSSKGSPMVPDPGIADTVRVDTSVAFVSGSGAVPVHFYNDEPLFGLEVTLRQPSAEVSIDSFSFVGSRVALSQFKNVRVSDDSMLITISVLTASENIPAGNGLLGTLYLSYPSSIVPQTVPIDSITWNPDPTTEYATRFYLPDVSEFTPKVLGGALVIQDTPVTLDSLWVPAVEAYPGQPLALDVFLYNERSVKDVSVALTWGASYLNFDSVQYTGTRGQAAQSKSTQYSNNLHQVLTVLNFTEAVPLAPGSGPVVRLFFSVATSPDTTLTVDTTTFASIQNSFLNLTSLDGGAQIYPIYHASTVHINQGTEVEDDPDRSLPQAYALNQNYPNPFNPVTIIEFALPRADHVRIDLFDILGRTVRTLVDETMAAGTHRISFDSRSNSGNSLATGVYFYRMSTSSFTATKKMLLMK